MKNQDKYAFNYDYDYEHDELVAIDLICDKEDDTPCYALVNKLSYKIGDILYIRETWCKYFHLEDDLVTPIDGTGQYYYRADGENPTPFNTFLVQRDGYDEYLDHPLWKPSIHMPKEAARIFLRVTDVRVERLQDIITEDYKTPLNINREGLISPCCQCTHHNGDCKDFIAQNSCKLLDEFINLWNSTVKKSDLDKYGWEANPWVWVIEFERVEVE
ncbi:MAG: hypothetical protein OSJ54_06295 [Oscillospiraceae bacterium]|nr:hypothetical protein [Oscillospiraceae bacterium]